MPERRGTLVSLYQLAITVGFLFAYFINWWILSVAETAALDSAARFVSDFMNRALVDEYWRGMLGSETIPALLFFFIIFLIPESPRWLIVRGQGAKASAVLQKIYLSEDEASRQKSLTEESIRGETKSEWSALLSPRNLESGPDRFCHCHSGPVYGGQCRFILWPGDFPEGWSCIWRRPVFTGSCRICEYGDDSHCTFDYR